MNATNNKVKCQFTKCSNCPEGFKMIAKKTANTHKRIDKVGEGTFFLKKCRKTKVQLK